MKGDLDIDPRGLIYESYRIEGIRIEECRSIFLDWALGMPLGEDIAAHLEILMTHYGDTNPEHPMTKVLIEGITKVAEKNGRRGGRKARVSQS